MRLAPLLTILPLLLPLAARAGEAAPPIADLAGLLACRDSAETVEIAFTYQGSACERVDPARFEAEEGENRVIFPVRSTADICTQQLVPIDVSQRVRVPTEVKTLVVQREDREGGIAASASTDVMAMCEHG